MKEELAGDRSANTRLAGLTARAIRGLSCTLAGWSIQHALFRSDRRPPSCVAVSGRLRKSTTSATSASRPRSRPSAGPGAAGCLTRRRAWPREPVNEPSPPASCRPARLPKGVRRAPTRQQGGNRLRDHRPDRGGGGSPAPVIGHHARPERAGRPWRPARRSGSGERYSGSVPSAGRRPHRWHRPSPSGPCPLWTSSRNCEYGEGKPARSPHGGRSSSDDGESGPGGKIISQFRQDMAAASESAGPGWFDASCPGSGRHGPDSVGAALLPSPPSTRAEPVSRWPPELMPQAGPVARSCPHGDDVRPRSTGAVGMARCTAVGPICRGAADRYEPLRGTVEPVDRAGTSPDEKLGIVPEARWLVRRRGAGPARSSAIIRTAALRGGARGSIRLGARSQRPITFAARGTHFGRLAVGDAAEAARSPTTDSFDAWSSRASFSPSFRDSARLAERRAASRGRVAPWARKTPGATPMPPDAFDDPAVLATRLPANSARPRGKSR